MRTLTSRTVLMLATVFAMSATQASEPATPLRSTSPDLERELDRQINKFVTYPLMEREHSMNGEVAVSFVINTEGKVEVIDAHSANAALCEYVLRKLSKVDIGTNPNGLWRTTHMRFVFHPEV